MVGAGWGGAGAVLAGLGWVEGLACGWTGDCAGRAGRAGLGRAGWARGLGWGVAGLAALRLKLFEDNIFLEPHFESGGGLGGGLFWVGWAGLAGLGQGAGGLKPGLGTLGWAGWTGAVLAGLGWVEGLASGWAGDWAGLIWAGVGWQP